MYSLVCGLLPGGIQPRPPDAPSSQWDPPHRPHGGRSKDLRAFACVYCRRNLRRARSMYLLLSPRRYLLQVTEMHRKIPTLNVSYSYESPSHYGTWRYSLSHPRSGIRMILPIPLSVSLRLGANTKGSEASLRKKGQTKKVCSSYYTDYLGFFRSGLGMYAASERSLVGRRRMIIRSAKRTPGGGLGAGLE
jgi:hypothetical protein